MVKRARWAVIVAAALVLTACQPNRFVSGWVPYWTASDSAATLGNADAASLYSEVSLMWFGTAADGSVPLMASSTTLANTVATARASGIPVIPTIFDTSAPGVMKAVIADPARMRQHVTNIVNRVVNGGYDGIDLDYEVFAFGDHMTKVNTTYTPKWVTFIQTLSTALHARGKLLAVTVPPVWNSGLNGYTFYAQDKIAPYVDRLRLMVYDWSISAPGPISPNFWVASTINYTKNIAKVPGDKVQLGLPAYGRHWSMQLNTRETCPPGALKKTDSITLRETDALAAAHGVTPERDSSGEIFFTWNEKKTGTTTVVPAYVPVIGTADRLEASAARAGLQPAVRVGRVRVVTCTVRHVVYSPDPTSIRASADAALAAGWSGIILWAVGYETEPMYQALGGAAGVAAQRPNGAPAVMLDVPVYTAPAGTALGSVKVSGLAWNPEFDLPVPVRIELKKAAAVVTTRTVLANLSRTGAPAGAGAFHGLNVKLSGTLAPGAYSVCITQLAWGGTPGPATTCKPLTV